MIILPSQPIPATRIDPKMLLIYGPPKVGKTTILSQLKNNLIVDTEEGSDFLEALKIKVTSLEEYEQACNLIKLQNPKPFKYITVDTIDKIEEWSEWHATTEYRKSNVGKNYAAGESVLKLPNGAGYMWLRDSFKKFTKMILPCAEYIIFVGHIRDKMIEEHGKEVSSKDLDLTGKIKSIMCSSVDAIGFLDRNSAGNLTINFASKQNVVCGGRCQHLIGKNFEMRGSEFDWSKIYTHLLESKEEQPKLPTELSQPATVTKLNI